LNGRGGFRDPRHARAKVTSESPHEIPPSIDANGAYTDFWQGAGVDRARLSDALAQLPDTADELNAIGKRCVLAAQCLSGVLGAVCADRRRCRALNFGNFLVVRRSNCRSGEAATDGRATTAANQRKAPQQAIDPDQPRLLE
jgi:hypothetical protein